MATIDLITYDQKMVTPKDDALIHQFGISNGVLYGCEVTLVNSNTLHITGGQGVIYGRQWEIAEGDITVTLPASGTLKGRLYVKIDLSNTTNPIELLVQTDVTLPDLTDDDQLNVNNSVSELELYTFDVSSLTISNLVRTVETVADGDHADVVQLQSDVSQLNSSLSSILPSTGACSIRTARSNISSVSGTYYKIGKVVIMTGTIIYTGSQTNQGNLYIDENTLPFYFKIGSLMGIAISNNVNLTLKSSQNNNNIWITLGASQINALNENITGKTLIYNLMGVLN